MMTSRSAILTALRPLAVPERAAFAQDYAPTAETVLGVPNPDWRRVCRAALRELRGAPPERVHALADELLEGGVFELRLVAYELVGAHRGAMARVDEARIEVLRRGLDNWAAVDHFGCGVSGRAWTRGQLPDRAVMGWTRSEDRWTRRLALVSTVPWNMKSHGGRGDARRTLQVCGALAEDRDDMVVKALNWALRSLAPWDRDAVEGFLEHRDLAARVRREVRRKLDTGRKNG